MQIRLAKREHITYLRTDYCCVRNYKDNNCIHQFCRKANICSEISFMYYSKSKSLIIYHYAFSNNENIIKRLTNIITHEFIHYLEDKLNLECSIDNLKYCNKATLKLVYNLANY